MRADGDKDGVIVLLQIREFNVFADPRIQLDFHAQLFNDIRFFVENIPGQAELRNAHRHHAAQLGQGFEDGHFIAGFAEVVSGHDAGRSAADDSHFLFLFSGDGVIIRIFAEVGGRPLERVDGDGFLDLAALALAFAGSRADSADNGGEGQGLFN